MQNLKPVIKKKKQIKSLAFKNEDFYQFTNIL